MPFELTRRKVGQVVNRREMTVGSYDPAKRTVELIAATDTPIRMPGWRLGLDGDFWEVLDMRAESIDLSQVEAGNAPLLDSHNRWELADRLGVVNSAYTEPNRLITVVGFGQSDGARAAEAEVAGNTAPPVSAGYRVNQYVFEGYDEGLPVMRAINWTFREVSFVPIAADPNAGARSEAGQHPCTIFNERKVPAMPDPVIPSADPAGGEQIRAATPAPAAPAMFSQAEIDAMSTLLQMSQRSAHARSTLPGLPQPVAQPAAEVRMDGAATLEFLDACRSVGLEDAQARTWATTLPPEAARSEMIRAAAAKQSAAAPNPAHGQAARVGHDDRDTFRSAGEELLAYKADPSKNKLTELGRQYGGYSLKEFGRRSLENNGVRTGHMSPRELAHAILSRSAGTSDFPAILGNTTGRTLREAYEQAGQTFKLWQRRATAPDFKQITRLQLSSAPNFLKVPEGGEYKQGYLAEAKEVYQLAKYGRLMSFTYEMLINDDLGAFIRIVELMGNAAAEFESDVAYQPLLGNPAMGDSVALFHANHGNLAGSGAAPSETTVSAGELAMTSQKGLASTGETARIMNIPPKFIIGGYKYRIPFKKLLAQTTPANSSDVNAYAGEMVPVLESRLNSVDSWFLAADYKRIDTIEYCYLEGEDGVFMDQEEQFRVDALDYKARLEFASKAIDYRGLYKNPGS